ncbi:MAG: 3'-5' exonuclease [Ilumatobacteraceae bacterium]
MSDLVSSKRFTIVDTETTGLFPANDRVLQIGAVIVRGDGTIEHQFSTHIKRLVLKPGRLGAHHVHGITRSDLLRGMALDAALVELQELLRGALFTAHNAAFDLGFLRAEAKRANFAFDIPSHICTLRMSRALDPKSTRSHKLSEVAKRYSISSERQHDALADALTTAAILPRLLDELKITTIDQLARFTVSEPIRNSTQP